MFETLGKKIYHIMEKKKSNKIVVITNHLKIDGLVHRCDKNCENLSKCILTLTDAVICRLNDYCACNEDGCECNDYVCFKYDWLHINLAEIVAFSILEA